MILLNSLLVLLLLLIVYQIYESYFKNKQFYARQNTYQDKSYFQDTYKKDKEGFANFMPDEGAHTMPDEGANTMPDEGAHTMPDEGANTMPDEGAHTMPVKKTKQMAFAPAEPIDIDELVKNNANLSHLNEQIKELQSLKIEAMKIKYNEN